MTDFPEGPATSPGFLLWHATLRWQRAMAAALAPHELTHAQFVLLATTWWFGGQGDRPSQARLSELTGSDPRMTSEVVRRLVAKGGVAGVLAPTHSWAKVRAGPPRGVAAAIGASAAVEQADRAFFGPAADTAGPALLPLLHALADR